MKRDGGPRLFFVSAGPDHPVPSDGLGFHKENSGSDVRRKDWTLLNVSCSDTRYIRGRSCGCYCFEGIRNIDALAILALKRLGVRKRSKIRFVGRSVACLVTSVEVPSVGAHGAAAFCVRAYCALVEPIFLPVQILDAEEKLLRQVRDKLILNNG